MIRIFSFVFIIFSLSLDSALASEHFPHKENGQGRELNTRLFYQHNENLTSLFQVNIQNLTIGRTQKNIEVGLRYSLLPELKLGLFIDHQVGLRHDNDWVNDRGSWKWIDSHSRSENIIQSELLLRYVLGQFMLEMRFRYAISSFNHEQTLKLRPTIYFTPNLTWTFSLSDEIQFPLNYSEKNINAHWIYLGALYHWNPHFFFGPFVGYSRQTWTTSFHHRQVRSDHYQASESLVNAGLNFNFYF